MTTEEMKKEIKKHCTGNFLCEGCLLSDKYIPFCYDGEDKDVIKSNYETIFGKPKFTLSDIKSGYLVRIRKGDLCLVVDRLNGKWGLHNKTDVPQSNESEYREDMTDVDDFTEYDIVEVYGLDLYKMFETNTRELLFKREEELSPRDIKIKELQNKMDAIKREMEELK